MYKIKEQKLTKINRFIYLLFFCSLFVLLASACNLQNEKKQEQTEQKSSVQNLTKLTISIEGMTCNACVASIKKKLNSMEDLEEVEVSLEHRNATVFYEEGKISPQQIRDAINELGYKAGEPITEKDRE
jgi:copper chaperone CopZ